MSQADKPKGSSSEPFVPSSDRPEVKPDTRLADLTVADLLGLMAGSGARSELAKPVASEIVPKVQLSKFEIHKYEHKDLSKIELWKLEHPKVELYKVEHIDIPVPFGPGVGPGPEVLGLEIMGLTARVQQLSSEVAQLRAKKT